MTANTVYEVFMALPETERQRFIVLVNKQNKIKELDLEKDIKPTKIELVYTKQNAIDYLLKTVFSSKK